MSQKSFLFCRSGRSHAITVSTDFGNQLSECGKSVANMMTVDLTDVPEANVGSPVVLWGEGLPIDDVASAAATVGYELLCAIAPRVPMIATEVGRIDLEL